MLSTNRRLGAKTGVRKLLTDLLDGAPDADLDAPRIEPEIRGRANPEDWPYWLLVLAAAQNRAIGVVEAWLDSEGLDEEVRDSWGF